MTALAWLYLLHAAAAMSEMGRHAAMEMAMPQVRSWALLEVVLLLVMWAVMMVAMMLPSAAPMILMFTMINRRRAEQQRPAVRTGIFVLAYVLVWGGFSVLAAVAQWRLQAAALLSPMMVSTSPYLGGGLLLAAGLFQWTPLKEACLIRCRSPLAFLMTEWREGARGALVMGLRHGAYCVGCCWMLMALLFVAGVMNLAWIAAIALFVLVEKVAPGGRWISRSAGVVLAGAGILVVVTAGG
jgi:predicted metal-binding membrane protein